MSQTMRGVPISVLLLLAASPASSQNPMVVISLDGLRPDYVLKADEHNLKIPNLRRILRDGAHATGVRGVLPTVTYPSHTTLMTGVWPVKHGIYSNVVLDPLGLNLDGWYWYAADIRVPTLWEAASKAGLVTASVSWPVSAGAGITYLIPEYWRAPKSPEDAKLRRIISTPGLMDEIGKFAGPYSGDLDDAENGDRSRTRYAVEILRRKHPQFTTIHLAALDHFEHAAGPFSAEANRTLEMLDGLVGQIESAALSISPHVILCVLSDHGFSKIDHELNLMAAFVQAGFITPSHISEWQAYPHKDGGSAAIFLRDPRDEKTKAAVAQLLNRLASDPANGIAKILTRDEIAAMGGRPDAAFWVDMKDNFAVGGTDGPVSHEKTGGSHGYAPSHAALRAGFFITGPGVQASLDLGEIDMRSIAPTLAKLLGVSFFTADLPSLTLTVR